MDDSVDCPMDQSPADRSSWMSELNVLLLQSVAQYDDASLGAFKPAPLVGRASAAGAAAAAAAAARVCAARNRDPTKTTLIRSTLSALRTRGSFVDRSLLSSGSRMGCQDLRLAMRVKFHLHTMSMLVCACAHMHMHRHGEVQANAIVRTRLETRMLCTTMCTYVHTLNHTHAHILPHSS